MSAPALSLVGWSGADGTFRITGVTPASYRVGADAPSGYADHWPDVHVRAVRR